MEVKYLIPYLFAYKLKYDNKKYDENELYNDLKLMGFDGYTEEETINQKNEITKKVYS